MTYTLPAALLAPILLVLALYALRWLLDAVGHPGTVRALRNIDLPPDVLTDVLRCFDDARAADKKTWWYDVSAPVVAAIALLFTPRSANRLPGWASKWDNNVSLNGDGEGVLRDGQWLTRGHDIAWDAPLQPGDKLFRYADPDYSGDAYYARGHHPRSWYARWVWVGLRNRASKLSVDLGRTIHTLPRLVSGDLNIGRSQPGHFLLEADGCYHFKSIERVRFLGFTFALIRSYGYKLEIVRNHWGEPNGQRRAAAVAIGASLKRWKGN